MRRPLVTTDSSMTETPQDDPVTDPLSADASDVIAEVITDDPADAGTGEPDDTVPAPPVRTFADFGVHPDMVEALSRVGITDVTTGFDDDHVDPYEGDARVLAATCDGVRVVSVYVPNGREVPSEFYDRKLAWLDALHDSEAARVQAYIRLHLRDADMNANSIAHANGITVRQLYRIWSSHPTTLAKHVLRSRLEGAREGLANPALQHASNAEIAASWGFANHTYFQRRFLTAFGVSAVEYRQEMREAKC